MKCCLSVEDLAQDEEFSVAISLFSPDQLHLGFFCKDSSGSKVIHLLGHYDLRASDKTNNYNYINVASFDEDDKVHMLAYVQSIYEMNCEDIPYGPCGGGHFDASGLYQGRTGDGLTCSLFVLEVFESQAYSFIDKDTWPTRDEDSAWQEDMIYGLGCKFNREPADVEHFENQGKLIGALRFKPQEVGASVTFSSCPNSFREINPIAIGIEKFLSQ